MVSWHPQGHRSAADHGSGAPRRYIVRVFKRSGISETRWIVKLRPWRNAAIRSTKRSRTS